MNTVTLKVDQAILIGSSLRLAPTDIERKSVRLLAEGQHLGGPLDGEKFRSTHELPKGGSLHLGPMVTVTVIELTSTTVRLGLLAPPHLPIAAEA